MKTMNKKPSFKAMLIAGLTGCVLSSPAFAQEDVERYRDELDRAQEEHMAEAEDFAARVLELARQQQANAASILLKHLKFRCAESVRRAVQAVTMWVHALKVVS